MDEIFEKPSSIILYRQLSVETVSNVNSDDHEEKTEKLVPKIVDVKIKDKVSETHCEIDQKHGNNSKNNGGQIIKKIPPPTPNRKRNSQLQTELSNESNSPKSNVSKLAKSNFVQELEKKLSNQPPKSTSVPRYLEMTSPVSQIQRQEETSEETQASINFIEKERFANDNQYISMYLATNSAKIDRSSSVIQAKGTNNPSENKKFADTTHLKEEIDQPTSGIFTSRRFGNSQHDTHIYEEMPLINESEEFSTPVALMKALKMKSQNTSNVDVTEEKVVNNNMATLRPKSPKPIITRNDKEESFWDKIGTLGRKKRSKEVQDVQEEGKYAIDSPGFAVTPIIPPEEYDLEENEERSIIMPKAFEDPKLRELIQVLIDWINDELASQRIIVQDLTEDLYDGQVLQKIFEMLTGHKLDVPEVTQSEEGQKQKLSVVLAHFNRVLGLPHNHNKWNVEVIHSKSIVPILHLLVALARHFRPPVRLPENVSVSVTVVQKTQGQLTHRIVREVITSEYSDVGMRCERDAFDTLFDHAPDKLQVVKKSMVTFVNKHLNKLNLEVAEIETQFHDGVYLIMLMGLLEGFFVPLYSFFPTPKDNDQKVHNVSFAFELMEEVGLVRPKARPEDVVNLDMKSTLRVLYNLFNKYKSLL